MPTLSSVVFANMAPTVSFRPAMSHLGISAEGWATVLGQFASAYLFAGGNKPRGERLLLWASLGL
jgi:hypothetical protein